MVGRVRNSRAFANDNAPVLIPGVGNLRFQSTAYGFIIVALRLTVPSED